MPRAVAGPAPLRHTLVGLQTADCALGVRALACDAACCGRTGAAAVYFGWTADCGSRTGVAGKGRGGVIGFSDWRVMCLKMFIG